MNNRVFIVFAISPNYSSHPDDTFYPGDDETYIGASSTPENVINRINDNYFNGDFVKGKQVIGEWIDKLTEISNGRVGYDIEIRNPRDRNNYYRVISDEVDKI